MTIRILCLHGMGLNSDVFRAQTAHFRALLPSSYTFHFHDGDITCTPSPSVEDLHFGPYHCYYTSPSTSQVARAHENIRALIEHTGGFHVVMGFSQGAALAASLLIRHQLEYPSAPPLFGTAVFICAPLPFSHDCKLGIDVRPYFGLPLSSPSLSSTSAHSQSTTVHPSLIPEPYFLRRDDKENISPSPSLAYYGDENGGPYYNMYHASASSYRGRIQIPTAHIYGRLDTWRPHSVALMELCDGPRVVFEHDGGHHIPREASEEIADVLEEVIARMGFEVGYETKHE